MQDIIGLLLQQFHDILGIMANIEFLGTNLLKFSLTIMVLGTLIPVIFTIVNQNTLDLGKEVKRETKQGIKSRINNKFYEGDIENERYWK